MAIHIIDKENIDRSDPTPNSHDTIDAERRMAHQTLSTAYASPGIKQTARMVFKNNMLVSYDSNNNISSVYGYISSVSSVPILVIAGQGKDVFTDVLGIARPAGL